MKRVIRKIKYVKKRNPLCYGDGAIFGYADLIKKPIGETNERKRYFVIIKQKQKLPWKGKKIILLSSAIKIMEYLEKEQT